MVRAEVIASGTERFVGYERGKAEGLPECPASCGFEPPLNKLLA